MIHVNVDSSIMASVVDELATSLKINSATTETRINNYHIGKARQYLDKDFCHWENYLKLLDYQKRTKIEQAMIIYALHCKYLEIVLNTSVEYLLSKPIWRNKYFQYLFESILDRLGASRRYNRKAVEDLIGKVQMAIAGARLETLTTDIYKPLLKANNIIRLTEED